MTGKRTLCPLVFEWQAVLALGIAALAARHQIALGRLAAANDRHQVIHGQLFRRELSAAVMADARGAFALSPLAFAQRARLLALAPDLLFGDFD